MKVYALTELGKRVAGGKWEDTEEFRTLDYIKGNRTATEDELSIISSRYTVNKLRREGLVRELTT